jgi:hypothetical protein
MAIKKLLLLLIFILTSLTYGNEFSRNENLSNLSSTNKKMVEDVNSIFKYVTSANGNNLNTKGTIELTGDGISTKLDLPVKDEEIKLFPDRSYRADIYITASQTDIYSKKEPVIKSFTISLNEYRRKIESTGSSLNDVVASLNVAKEKLNKYQVSFTGKSFRFTILIFTVIFMIISFYFAFKFLTTKEAYIFQFTLMLLSQFALYGLEWEKIFPSFQLNITQTTLLEQLSPLLTLIGVVLAIVIPLIALIRKAANKNVGSQ